VDLKTVSERLGHTSIKVTADRYAHVTPRMRDRSAQTMEGIMSRIRSRIRSQQRNRTDESTGQVPAVNKKTPTLLLALLAILWLEGS
jgi:hypothetical protein